MEILEMKNSINQIKKSVKGWVLVAHSCNPSDPGGRDQEDYGSKPVWANNL
jgi:hypothetical protein